MIADDLAEKRRRLLNLFDEEHTFPTGDLSEVAAAILEKRDALLALAKKHGPPFYAFDRRGFAAALTRFRAAFDARLLRHRPFYAVKSNHHPLVVAAAVEHGFGLDVSSRRELDQALAFPGVPIVFSGPGKSPSDLEAAARHPGRVTVQLDSFRELERLGEVTARLGVTVTAGVRVSTSHHGAWSKFGIPLGQLGRFFAEARLFPGVKLAGVQAHLSWNRSARPYELIIEELGTAFRAQLTAEDRAAIAFVDLGGGYRPHRLEGYFPSAHPLGEIIRAADAHAGEETKFLAPYYVKDSIPLEEYARVIGAAVAENLTPILSPDVAVFTEPGRVVSTYAMHLVVEVVDKKAHDLVIVSGGINMVGWEKFEQVYCPVVDLTRPSLTELEVRLGGSLCDSEDTFGSRVHASAVEEGDVLVVPFQGAYSFATAQDFIRPIPPVFELEG